MQPQVDERRQLAELGWERSVQAILVKVQLGQSQIAEFRRDRPDELVLVHPNVPQSRHSSNFGGDGADELVVEQVKALELLQVADEGGNGSLQLVAAEGETIERLHGPDAVRDGPRQLVVVQIEMGQHPHLSELLWDGPRQFIRSQIDGDQRGQLAKLGWQRACQLLGEDFDLLDLIGGIALDARPEALSFTCQPTVRWSRDVRKVVLELLPIADPRLAVLRRVA
mmetsp:Transcript_14857/g.42047  ORF Transcript_14857/g.42047 Transcript_14857/m.42047 type:complete len:225 (+) Transcript_14857:842-1516(+)